MNLAVKLFLILFITFLATPTIVSMIEKSSDTSYFYSTSEEEEQAHTEIKANLKSEPTYLLSVLINLNSSLITSANLSKHDNVAATIFIPPPEQV